MKLPDVGTPEHAALEARIISRLDVRGPDDCWLWLGAKSSAGYGMIVVDGETYGVHRLAFELRNGKLPSKIFVCHTCDTPLCGNLRHLFSGTTTDNLRDAAAKKRFARQRTTHCKNGHLLNDANIYRWRPTWRQCRACQLASAVRSNLKKKQAK